jgi:peptidoglycan/LPS O-acetylase OafA/YrhL
MLGLSGASLLRLHNGPDVAAGVLLIGCLLALWADRLEGSPLARPLVWALGMLAIFATSLGDKSVSFYLVWLPLAIAGATVVIAYLAQDKQTTWVTRMMTWRPLLYLGKISYGLYLWHFTVYYVVRKNLTTYPAKPLVQISLSLVVATLSYYLVEKRFLRMKNRMRQPAAAKEELVAISADA